MASDRHCLASVEKGSSDHDGVMVGRTDTANSDGRGCLGGGGDVCVRVHACVRDVFAIYDNDIFFPMLIMIIINIIIFHTIYKSDILMIPLNGYRSSINKIKK